MHWADKLADEVIANAPNKAEYVCAAGISPSGSVHIGNFRDIVTGYFVCQALRKRGKKARLLFSWDEFDRMRKVPANVAELRSDFAQYIGKPYADVPDPFGCHETYAEHFEREFESALAHFGIEVDFRYQAAEYRLGRYVPHILTALEKRGEIFDILDSFRTQEAQPGEREAYYPVSIYCPVCGKDDTSIFAYDDASYTAQYKCKCGHTDAFCFTSNFNCKLSWKTDWPMRWMVEGVDFEPGGKDHSSPTGSFATSKVISERVYGFAPPIYTGYEFIGIKGATGKMSGSTGLNLTPAALFKLYQPEVILWLYAKTDPMKAFNFCFDDEILRQYFEFDKMLTQAREGGASELTCDIMNYSAVPGREIKTVPMAQLVSFGSIVDFVPEMLETIFEKISTPFSCEDFEERVNLAKYWLYQCSPGSVNRLQAEFDSEFFTTLTAEEQDELIYLHDYLAGSDYTMDDLQAFLYGVPTSVRGKIEDQGKLKQLQAAFFRNVYRMLIGKEKGPRLYLFLFALEKAQYLQLLPSKRG